MQSAVKLGVIIPTKDRPDEVRRLLKEISAQDLRPDQIIIVDGGSPAIDGIVNEFPELGVDYVRSMPPSLTAQRNAGIRALRSDITVAIFFDDDIRLETKVLSNMAKFWMGASEDTGGAAFNLINDDYRRPGLLEKVFMVNSDQPLSILKSGFQGRACRLDQTRRVDWLIGCSMAWRREVFKEFLFDEKFSGYARYEEVDFSYRVGRKYKLFVVSDAGVRHYTKPEDTNISFAIGKMETVNRLYFVRKNSGLSVMLCLWALFGVFMNNIVKGILFFDKRCLLRAMGNMSGLIHTIFCKQ